MFKVINDTNTTIIKLSNVAWNYELRNIQFSMLPSFYGLANEDPLSFIRDFYSIIQTFFLDIPNKDQLIMRYIPYVLKDRAKAWLLSFPIGSLMTWDKV